MDSRYRIDKTFISCTTPNEAKSNIEQWVKDGIKGYVCIANVRSVSFSNKHEDYRNVMNGSLMTTPDGMPLVWMARLWGLKNVQRTVGPDLFVKMLSDNASGIKHFLLGDTNETLNSIREKYPNALIVGSFSPPFCEVDEFDYENIASKVNKCGADVIWISLRSPKQDYFAKRLVPFLEKGVCVSVGAAFRFAVGGIKHPSKIVQNLGLTGIFWRKMNLSKIWWYIEKFSLLLWWGMGIICCRIKRRISK